MKFLEVAIDTAVYKMPAWKLRENTAQKYRSMLRGTVRAIADKTGITIVTA